MVRQYIGARYVPKFYENSDGTSEWRSGVIYEPLTIVTWNGNSYTSKRAVPAEIGDPSLNPGYWVATGNYNQQIDAILEAMQTLQGELNKGYQKIVLLSDSYGADAATGGDSWISQTITELGSRVIHSKFWGGAGFGWNVNSEYYFPALFSNDLTADSSADIVLLLAGANDGNLINNGSATESNITAGITAGINVLKGLYPNAQIVFGFVGRNKNPGSFKSYFRARNAYLECQRYGAYYLNNSEYCLHNRGLIGSADLHPNLAGSTKLAQMAVTVLNGWDYEVIEDHVVSPALTISVRNDRTFYRWVGTAAETHVTYEQTVSPFGAPYEVTAFGSGAALFNPVGELDYHENAAAVMISYQFKPAQVALSGNANGNLSVQFMSIDGSCTGEYAIQRIVFPKVFTIESDTMLC